MTSKIECLDESKTWLGVSKSSQKWEIISIPMWNTEEEAREVLKYIRDSVNFRQRVQAYVTLLQNGDPENESPKKILDYIDEVLQ